MPLQLLIIDDSELNLKLTELMLAKIDCHTDAFSDVREALRSVRDHDYDLVFMDYLMPDINGIEATRLIRSMTGGVHSLPNYYERLPIIALTAEDDSIMQQRMKENGINDVLMKPFKLVDVCAVIDRWCGTSLLESVAHKSASHEAIEVTPGDSILPTIVGISDETLKEMLRIDREGFLETLTLFTEDTPDKHVRINEALECEDYETYCVEIHRIKGETSIIGAYKLSTEAAHLNELGKALLNKDISPTDYEEKLSSVTSGTAALLNGLDVLCSTADTFLSFAGRKTPGDDGGSITSFKHLSGQKAASGSGKSIDREKLIRYVEHAKEALDSGDTALAKEWLTEIGEHIKKN